MISGFSLELCANSTLNPPVLVNNNTLFIEPGKNKAVTTDLLKTTDVDNTDDQLIYTLMTVPQYGQLQVNGNSALLPGVQFYQTDLNNGAVRYFHYGGSSSDAFCFTVTDGQGGMVQDCFNIQPFRR
jgi:VCBS repeat-containing protein